MTRTSKPTGIFAAPDRAQPAAPQRAMPTFAEVKQAVVAAPGLSRGTRSNLLRAVDLVAAQMGAAGLAGVVDIERIARRFEKVTPAMLGFRSAGSLSSTLSNFRRALRIAGVNVMPGRSRAPLSASWAGLRYAAEPLGCWPAISRFAHWCAEHQVAPGEVTDGHVERFLQLVRATSIKSRADGAYRRLVRAWRQAQAKVDGWPEQPLSMPARRKSESAPEWSAYPRSLEADARAFVDRGSDDDDWLSLDALDAPEGARSSQPLRAATRANYLYAIRRAAGELVASGIPPEDLKSLADLARPDRVRTILKRVAERTGRQRGSAVGLLAVVLLLIGRDHAKLPEHDVAKLKLMERKVRAERRMGDRTHDRLVSMGDKRRLRALLNLPHQLMRLAERRQAIDLHSARLVRCAVFLRLLLDTALRQGNVVALDLEHHIKRGGPGGLTVMIDGCEVKNGVEVVAPLRRDTVKMIELYVSKYRPVHAGQTASAWLFPRPDGSHWTTDAANQTMQDLTAKHIGFPVNPHLVRSLILEILEHEHPGALALGRDALGHRSIATTEAHYARRQAARAREIHQDALDRFRGRG